MTEKNYILNEQISEKKLERIAYEIAERNAGVKELVLAGIQDNGYVIAKRLKSILEGFFPGTILLLAIEIDKKFPTKLSIVPALDVNGKVIILVDDVANTGKTLTYSLQAFTSMYPASIQTAILVERTHKKFPVTSDYVGLSVATTLQEQIIVEVKNDEIAGAYLI